MINRKKKKVESFNGCDPFEADVEMFIHFLLGLCHKEMMLGIFLVSG
jgi:hypothetical protein